MCKEESEIIEKDFYDNKENSPKEEEIDMATISFDREIILNDISAEALAKKIEHDKKNRAVFNDINIEKKMEEGRKLLKQLFSR